MTSLRILHTESSCGWGGQELRILSEAEGLQARGHQLTLVCPAEARIYQAAQERGLEVVALPIERKKLSALWALRQWLAPRRHQYDLINTHSSTDSWLTALACASLADAPPIVRTRHVSSPINQHWTTRWLYQRAAKHVVVTGEPLRQYLAAHNGFALESMTSVPTGIRLERFYPRDKAVIKTELGIEGRVIGILATLRNWKGHTYLLDAFSRLVASQDDLQLLIVGDGPQRANLERRVAELGLTQRVRFSGNQDDPERWLNAMDIFVLPSYGDEGVSQAVMQAMATGLPVITTAVGGMLDAVQHEQTGLIVPIKDDQALEQALQRLLSQPQLAAQLAEAGYQRAQQLFGLETMLDRMESIFQRFARRAG
ncbi:glycosyltransferase family 4 protein [Balneatrix alpica]|uniref:glycosyltransferase family 4 protein n=1 Tax=Balneatrix alpica TaxID=75684 RepID=UPI00273A0F3E|nr:glycosyltransferase family 4 protein [Balneatrix alpica]